MTDRFKLLYMDLAKRVAELSYCENKKVGCIIVDESGRNIIAFGFNGSPRGFDNNCECDGRTLPTTLHAESNALTKVARCHYSSENAILFTTTSPCIECSKLIIQSGIKEVYYSEMYRNMQGIELLEKANIKVEHYE